MINNEELIEKLTKNVKKIQDKIEFKNLYNIRNIVVRLLLKSGICIDFALPFITALLVILNISSVKDDLPFHIDEITVDANIETIDASNDAILDNSFYDGEIVEYLTEWTMNDGGIYERVVTSYKLDDKLSSSDKSKVINMSKDELDKMFTVSNVKTINKDTLSDYYYLLDDSNTVIIIDHLKEKETITRLETKTENFVNSLNFLCLLVAIGNVIAVLKKLTLKDAIKNKLSEYDSYFKFIRKSELETMKKILQLRQENLMMLDDNYNNIGEHEGYSYRLRKREGDN